MGARATRRRARATGRRGSLRRLGTEMWAVSSTVSSSEGKAKQNFFAVVGRERSGCAIYYKTVSWFAVDLGKGRSLRCPLPTPHPCCLRVLAGCLCCGGALLSLACRYSLAAWVARFLYAPVCCRGICSCAVPRACAVSLRRVWLCLVCVCVCVCVSLSPSLLLSLSPFLPFSLSPSLPLPPSPSL